MKIVEIFPPNLYCISYSDCQEGQENSDEYHRLLNEWTDIDWLVTFFEEHWSVIDQQFWSAIAEPEMAAARTYDEAYLLEEKIHELVNNTRLGTIPDFDSYFIPLGGKYIYEWNHTPVKGYGPQKPSLIRLYAIRLGPNCYLITGGGIKYCRTMEESPELNKELRKIDRVKDFLKECGIDTQEDI